MALEPPAYRLEGLVLPGGWKVGARQERTDNGTYSVGYRVERNGQRAFLKALDFSKAESAPDFPRALQALVEAYNFERNLLNTCLSRKMDRVIAPLEDGQCRVDDSPFGQVSYLILEGAERDVRAHLRFGGQVDRAWKLRSLHHVATGLSQLHGANIAHQDIKPSNVVVFEGITSKIADLGRAALKGTHGPADDEPCAGERSYAPPELLYGYVDPEWNRRRFGTDAYLLGSMVFFFFSGLNATAHMLHNLAPEFHPPPRWAGTYDAVLPYIRDAFGRSAKIFADGLSEEIRDPLVQAVGQLCDPDLSLRGHPRNRGGSGNQYSLERYVATLNVLATKAEIELARSAEPFVLRI
jgi:serine/threonine protein kinase